MNGEPTDKCRRTFFRDLFVTTADQARSVYEEFQGRPQMRLPDLGLFPDQVLRNITPVFSADMAHELSGTTLCMRSGTQGDVLVSLQLTEAEASILSLFDCGLTLQQVAEKIDDPAVPGAGEAYLCVKTLFLKLAKCGVCHPAESLADVKAGES